jgi:hypothetical protein
VEKGSGRRRMRKYREMGDFYIHFNVISKIKRCAGIFRQ